MTENQRKPLPLHIPSCRWLPSKRECRDRESGGDVVKTSCWQSSKGECSDGKDEGDVVKTSRWLSSKEGV